MKKVLFAALAAAASLSATVAHAQDKFTIQLQWVTQAQFAGYYVAKDKGFYDAVGLDVTIKPGGPDIAPPQILAGGGADIMVNWMPSALCSGKWSPRGQRSAALQVFWHDVDLPPRFRHCLDR